MHIGRKVVSAGLVLLMHAIPTAALAGDTPAGQVQKAKVVSRLYQATYGAQMRCSATPEWTRLGKTLERFRTSYPELIQLLDSSPYLPAARDNFHAFLVANPPAKANQQDLQRECESLETILRSLTEGPGAQEAVAGYVQLLKS